MKTLLVIFGITGDLSTRKLLPALSHIVDEQKGGDLHVVGVSRREFDVKELIQQTTSNERLAAITSSLTMDVAVLSEYQKLAHTIKEQSPDQTLIYLSVPPGAAAQIVDLLGEAGINTPDVHILFEKPFGLDLDSAQEFIARTGRYFDDSQLYRIDHYMAKEIAAEILRIRREATDADLQKKIKSVTIVASEKIGIEGRVQFYEQTGALRDFIQGHLMQLLALVLIRKPSDAPLPEQRFTALSKVLPVDPARTVRGQYEGYQAEVQNPGSTVETFVAVQLESTDPLWQGVPLRLITGKALNEKRSYIKFVYEDNSERVLEEGEILLQEGNRRLDAYERVLVEAIKGNEDIFTTGAEVLRSWEILAPLQRAWDMNDVPLVQYKPGMSLESIL